MKDRQRCLKAVALSLVAATSSAEGVELIGLNACTPLGPPVAQVTAPPTQYADFCRVNRGHCDMTGPAILYVDAAVRRIVDQVNRAVNSEIEFAPDPEWKGEEEVWSYLLNGRGDCEDLALEKRRRPVEIGLPRASLTMAIVHHKAELSSHAVLLAETSDGTFVLDNMSDDIRCWSDAQLNYESRERPDGQWARFDQSTWTFETTSVADGRGNRAGCRDVPIP